MKEKTIEIARKSFVCTTGKGNDESEGAEMGQGEEHSGWRGRGSSESELEWAGVAWGQVASEGGKGAGDYCRPMCARPFI